MAFHRSSSAVAAFLKFNGFDSVFGAGAAIESHKSSSLFLVTLAVFFGRELATEGKKKRKRSLPLRDFPNEKSNNKSNQNQKNICKDHCWSM